MEREFVSRMELDGCQPPQNQIKIDRHSQRSTVDAESLCRNVGWVQTLVQTATNPGPVSTLWIVAALLDRDELGAWERIRVAWSATSQQLDVT